MRARSRVPLKALLALLVAASAAGVAPSASAGTAPEAAAPQFKSSVIQMAPLEVVEKDAPSQTEAAATSGGHSAHGARTAPAEAGTAADAAATLTWVAQGVT